jgi:hypothetical protein
MSPSAPRPPVPRSAAAMAVPAPLLGVPLLLLGREHRGQGAGR